MRETRTPATSTRTHTIGDSGSMKENRSIDLEGEDTYRMEMPRSRKGMEKSTTSSRSELMVRSPTAMSALPSNTSPIIPFHVPSLFLEP